MTTRPRRVDHPGRGVHQLAHRGCGADDADPVADDGERFGPRSGGDAGEDFAIDDGERWGRRLNERRRTGCDDSDGNDSGSPGQSHERMLHGPRRPAPTLYPFGR